MGICADSLSLRERLLLRGRVSRAANLGDRTARAIAGMSEGRFTRAGCSRFEHLVLPPGYPRIQRVRFPKRTLGLVRGPSGTRNSHRRLFPPISRRRGHEMSRGGRLGQSPVSEHLLSLPGFVVFGRGSVLQAGPAVSNSETPRG